jgi:opine dehydrogenase
MKITILGAGNGGQAMAADLTLAGHDVRLAAVPGHSSAISIINACGGLYLEGTTSGQHATGFARIPLVTTDVALALRGAEVVMVVIPAYGQEEYMREIIAHGEPGQIVVFNPGKFGALAFRKMLRDAGRENDFIIGETASLIYAAKPRRFDRMNIKAVKSELMFAALPSTDTRRALAVLKHVFPQFTEGDNIMATSVDDTSLVLHTVSTLMNTSRIELMGPYRNAHYDVTPSVGRAMESLDAERMSLCRAFGNYAVPFVLTLRFRYDAIGENLYEALKQVPAYRIQMSPDSLKHRYVTEEVPYGLVPVTEIARVAGIPTPGMDAIVHLASIANGIDYRTEGRTLAKLGLEGMPLHEIIDYIAPGWEGYYA